MINIFGKMRYHLMEKNPPAGRTGNTGKYLKYAIGEIILVVIGILIALQINNLNEARKDKLRERGVLVNLVQDLRSDSISYSRNLTTLTNIKLLHNKLYEIGIKNKSDIVIENPNNIRRTLYYNPIAKANDPFIASKISSDSIRKEVLSYFRLINDLDDSYGEFDNVVQNRMRIYLGRQKVHILSGWFENQDLNKDVGFSHNVISEDDLISLSKMEEFQQLLFEASIKLSETLNGLKLVIEQNNKLKNTIKKELGN